MNLFKFPSHNIVIIEVFDPCSTLCFLKQNNIKIYRFKKYDEYHYTFITHNKYTSFLKSKFKSFKIINKIGLINILRHNILKISTIISIIFSLLLFSFMNNLIMGININGDSSSLIYEIKEVLNKKGIKKYQIKKDESELLKIEKEISIELYDKIEWIEVKNQGLNVVVNFLKRRESFDIKNSKKALYATKQGVIKNFELEKGVKVHE